MAVDTSVTVVTSDEQVMEKYGYGEVLQTLIDKATYQKSVSSPVILRLCETIQEGLIADTKKIGMLKGENEKLKRTCQDHENLKNKKSALGKEYTLLNQKYKALKLEVQGFNLERNQWQEDKHFLEEEIRQLRDQLDKVFEQVGGIRVN